MSSEIFNLRGFQITGETIRQWSLVLGVELGKSLRARRQGKAGNSWYVDETYLLIKGRWCYLYRAIDKKGNLVDVYLSDTRDQNSAIMFFNSAKSVTRITPDKVTTDKNAAYPKAISQGLGETVTHRTNKYLNNRIEQNHRGIKSCYGPMKAFKDFFCTLKFCYIFEEIQNYFRTKNIKTQEYRMIVSKYKKFNLLLSCYT